MKLVVLAMTGMLLSGVQAGLIYFPRPYSPDELEALRAEGLIEIAFETRQGKQAAFYKAPAAGMAEKIWLVFGGNGARAADYRDLASHAGHGLLFVDYPSYGKCAGKPSPRAIDANAMGAVSALAAQQGVAEEVLRSTLCAFGHSLGAAAALRSAIHLEIDELVLVAPFTTMKEMAEIAVGKLLSRALTHRFDNVKGLAELVAKRPEGRVTIFHGTADEVIPIAMARRLAKPHPEAVTLHEIEGGDHNSIVATQLAEILMAMRREE